MTGFAAPDFGEDGAELAGVRELVGDISSGTGWAELSTGDEFTEEAPFEDKEEK